LFVHIRKFVRKIGLLAAIHSDSSLSLRIRYPEQAGRMRDSNASTQPRTQGKQLLGEGQTPTDRR
jgi:hypothetical protein